MAVNILLLGRTGNGKSSTGNSILGRKAFKVRMYTEANYEEIMKNSCEINGKVINVVEGPGLGDIDLNSYEEVDAAIKSARHVIDLCPEGFNAICVVYKYGVRFTNQEKLTTSLIKDFFGENVLKSHGVIILTCGDNFAKDSEEEKVTFEAWCSRQTGDINAIFRDVDNRRVLFNNRADDNWTLTVQREELLLVIDKIKSAPYSLTDFTSSMAEGSRKLRLVSSKYQHLEEEHRRIFSQIDQAIARVDVYGKPDLAIVTLKELQVRLAKHNEYLIHESDGTEVMKPLLDEAGVLSQSLKTKINMATLAKERAITTQPEDRNDENTAIYPRGEQSSSCENCCECIIECCDGFFRCVRSTCNVCGSKCGVSCWDSFGASVRHAKRYVYNV